MTAIHCRCGAAVGHETPASYDSPAEVNLRDGMPIDERGEAFCSEECYREAHPYTCKACGDAKVAHEHEVCAECRSTEPGDWIHQADYLHMKELAAYSDALAEGRAA